MKFIKQEIKLTAVLPGRTVGGLYAVCGALLLIEYYYYNRKENGK